MVLREPVGVVGIITSWNFPFIIASERMPWAIGAGCTVVLKPSELTSGTSVRMAELARDAGIPDGVFNVVTGYGAPAGQTLAEDPRTDLVAFTGSVAVGTKLAEIGARQVKRMGWSWAAKARKLSLPTPISKPLLTGLPTAFTTMPDSAAFREAA